MHTQIRWSRLNLRMNSSRENFYSCSRDESMPFKWKRLFEGRQRRFWVQLQGQFKETTKGTIFMGGEVPRPMNLGTFTRICCKGLMGVAKKLVPGLHYSFGDDQEAGHICFPLHKAADQFVHTPEGQTPSELGQFSIGEADEDRSKRRKLSGSTKRYSYLKGDTYTFFFHSHALHFPTWQVVDIPGFGNMDLGSFWEDMPMHIVGHEADPELSAKHALKKPHLERKNRYLFDFEVQHTTNL